MRFRLRTLLIVLALAFVAGLVGFATVTIRKQAEMIRDAYCLDWASAAIVQHLDDNEGRYPRSWTDLKPAFDKVTARDQSFSFEEVKSRVMIDFSADASAPPKSTPQFLRPQSGRTARWGNPDPDERIRSRLRQQNSR